MIIKGFNGKFPIIHESAYISENASIIGDVEIGENSSIWFGAVVRGDVCNIKIGKNSNIQDNAVIHVNYNLPSILGDFVTVGHSAIIHGATIGNFVIIGMGAILLDDVKVGENVIVAAGSLVPRKMEIPNGVMVMGVPAKIVRQLREEEIEHIKKNALDYVALSKSMINK